jgi:hypothetical protein
MEINGLPAHPLIIHAAAVFLPLAAVSSLVFISVPKWRWATRYPTALLALVAVGSVLAAYFSGRNLRDELESQGALGTAADEVARHAERADVLIWLTIVFAVMVLISARGLGGPSALVSGKGEVPRHSPLVERSLISMVAMLAVALLAMTAYTGDAGSQAVWNWVY